MAKRRFKSAEAKKGVKFSAPSVSSTSTEDKHMVFSFCNMQKNMDIHGLDNSDEQAAFLKTLYKLGTMKWKEINSSHRHGLGCEKIHQNSIKVGFPGCISEDTSLYSFRWNGMHCFVGYRDSEIFHILWIERAFGDLYDH